MKASETSLQKIIEGTIQYVVPLYQRTYSWDTKEWGVLWGDIAELCEEETPRKHFIGSIVTMPTQSVPEGVAKFLLIDGQQRMTTALLLLAAIRDRADEIKVGNLGMEVEHTLLRNMFKQGNDTYKLLPTQGDREAFTKIISKEAAADGSQVGKAYRFFAKSLRNSDYDLAKLKQIVVTNLVLVSIVLDRDDNPHLIFESLNAKGRALSQADLIRNYFFMRIHVDQQDHLYQNLWKPMQDRLGDDLTECIRHFLMKDGAIVKQGEVYFALKGRADGRSSAEVLDYLNELVRFAGHYAKLLHPEHEADPAVRERLLRLNRIEVTTAYPFFLNVYDDFAGGRVTRDEFIEVLDIVENFTIRRWVCAVPTYGLNKIFPPLYGQAKAHGSFVAGLRATLSTKNYPRDEDFRARITANKLYGPAERVTKTKLILERIEQSFGHKEVVDSASLTIEHVMPQTPSDWWQQHLGENWRGVHDLLLHSIGNLTLTGYNSPLSNDPFPTKKALLAKSHLELNRWFEKADAWGEQEIHQRADSLADRALSIWPYFGSEEASDPSGPETPFDTTALRQEAMERIAAHLGGIQLVKKGQTAVYTAEDGDTVVVCLASQPYSKAAGWTQYWYGFTPAHRGLVEEAKHGFVAMACGDKRRVLLFHASDFVPLLDAMDRTNGEHWHVLLFEKSDALQLNQPRKGERLDVQKHLLPPDRGTDTTSP